MMNNEALINEAIRRSTEDFATILSRQLSKMFEITFKLPKNLKTSDGVPLNTVFVMPSADNLSKMQVR